LSVASEIQKVANALEEHGYQSDFAEDELLYVLHTDSGKKLTLSSVEPGVVAIGFAFVTRKETLLGVCKFG
jgi:hypothetical protein